MLTCRIFLKIIFKLVIISGLYLHHKNVCIVQTSCGVDLWQFDACCLEGR